MLSLTAQGNDDISFVGSHVCERTHSPSERGSNVSAARDVDGYAERTQRTAAVQREWKRKKESLVSSR